MYIDVVPNRNSPPAILLRTSYREDGKVKKKTLANLSQWPEELVEGLGKLLKGAVAVAPEDLFTIESSPAHGHVQAVLATIKKLRLDSMISSKPCRQRNLALAMISQQILHPGSKLQSVRLWPVTTLAEELQVSDADEDDLYAAMDWLYDRQARIENKLAGQHLGEGAHALYDITSSYYEGHTCPLIQFGYNRDAKKGKKIIVYGMLTNAGGCPVAVDVYPGNTQDPLTVADQAHKLRHRFGLQQVVLVGDRGMLTQTQIDHLKDYGGIGWITALGYPALRNLAGQGHLQLSLFDQSNIAEITCADYPQERLVACYNPLMAQKRHKQRQALLEATEADLGNIAGQVARRKRKQLSGEEIGVKVGRVLNKYKMGKHFELTIGDGVLAYRRNEAAIAREADLDGIYVIRTSEPKERLSSQDVVRGYKNLSQVEQLFRSLKGVEILVRPIRHREEQRVRAHIFICMLAWYVEWHMRKALAPLLFDDQELDKDRQLRDPVAPAWPSASAEKKKRTLKTPEGLPVQSFKTLLAHLGTRTRNRCRFHSAHFKGQSIVHQLTELTPIQKKAYELLNIRTQ